MSVAPVVDDMDAERLRIARELHDVISYGFATISLQAGAAVQVVGEKPHQAVEALQAIRVASKEALEDLRGILGLLRHADESAGQTADLDRLERLVATTRAAGVPTRLNVSGRVDGLPGPLARAAYRIVQEALTNVLRHAGPASATVSLAYEGDRLHVTVEDDGAGQPEGVELDLGGSGYGVLGMRERALALGGDLDVGPRPEGGFRVDAYLPVPRHS